MRKIIHTWLTKEQSQYGLYSLVIFCAILSSCQVSLSPTIQNAHHLLWTDADSCLNCICDIDPSQLGKVDAAYHRVCYEHANLRARRQVDSITKVIEAAELLARKKYHNIAGEAYYVVGTFMSLTRNEESTFYLKQAEYQILHSECPDEHLLGLVYYRLGNIASHDRMFEIACEYYKQSIPYLGNNALYTACAYRDLGMGMQEEDVSLAINYLDTALSYAKQIPDSSFKIEIEASKMYISNAPQDELAEAYKKLCNQYKRYMYGGRIANFYLQQDQLDSAKIYIDILAKDTVNNIWSKEQFYTISSRYLATCGLHEQALQMLQHIHEWQTQEIESTAYARAYTIAQKYDVSKEQELNLELRIKKQKTLLLLLLILIGTLILIFMLVITHVKHQREITNKNLQLSQLNIKNQEKQIVLHHKLRAILLRQRLDNIKRASTSAQIKELFAEMYEDVNVTYNNQLEKIKTNHPNLTHTDMLVIMLLFLDLSIEDCCLLLNMTKESMWVRRKRIKQHLNLSAETNLEDWISLQKSVGSISQD